MAEMLEVSCRECGTQEVQLNGPLSTGHQPRCEQCGATRLVPWSAPGARAHPDRASGEAMAEWVAEAAGTCSCGGRFSLDAAIRCSVCRSTNVSTTFVGVAD